MCCRYITGTGIYELVIEELGMKGVQVPRIPAADVNPGTAVPLVAAGEKGPRFLEAVWGFPREGSQLIINARSESVLAKPTFASSFEARRCLVPASGFYEWDASKRKFLFRYPEGGVMYLAALWNLAEDALRFVVLTTAANGSMSPVHDRMPLMIDGKEALGWLFDGEKAKAILGSSMPLLSSTGEDEQLSFL